MRVFITGGANGIGRATVEKLLENSHEVVVYDWDREALGKLPDSVTTYEGDVYDEERVKEVVESEDFDVLVNCAGEQFQAAVEDLDMDVAERMFKSNVHGLIRVTQHALPALRKNTGRVVNISSLAGRITGKYWGVYAATKHAVEAVSDTLRLELSGFGVEVVIVEPGPIRTGFNERGRDHMAEYVDDSVYADEYREKLAGEIGGVSAEKAARVVYRAITATHPKTRYTVTWEAKIAPKIKAVLPTRVWDWLINKWG